MSYDRNRARTTLEELLDLAGVKPDRIDEEEDQLLEQEAETDYEVENLSEAAEDDEEEEGEDNPEIPAPATVKKGKGKEEEEEPKEPEEEPEEKEKKKKKEEPEEEDGELHDTWTVNIKTGGKFKFEMYENYFYVWYRSKKSERIEIPPKFKAMRKEMAKLFNEIMTYVEKAS
jgi:hypothetical protein